MTHLLKEIKKTLNHYNLNKGIFRRIFGDHPQIKLLRNFYQNNSLYIPPEKLPELQGILSHDFGNDNNLTYQLFTQLKKDVDGILKQDAHFDELDKRTIEELNALLLTENDPQISYELASRYQYGYTVPMNQERAAYFYGQCFNNPDTAKILFTRASNGNKHATFVYGRIFELGKDNYPNSPCNKDITKALNYYERLFAVEYAPAIHHLVLLKSSESWGSFVTEQKKYYDVFFNQNYALSQCFIGNFYQQKPEHENQALQYYEKALQSGYFVETFYSLYQLYANSRIHTDNSKFEKYKYLMLAAEAGHNDAKVLLEQSGRELAACINRKYSSNDDKQIFLFYKQAKEFVNAQGNLHIARMSYRAWCENESNNRLSSNDEPFFSKEKEELIALDWLTLYENVCIQGFNDNWVAQSVVSDFANLFSSLRFPKNDRVFLKMMHLLTSVLVKNKESGAGALLTYHFFSDEIRDHDLAKAKKYYSLKAHDQEIISELVKQYELKHRDQGLAFMEKMASEHHHPEIIYWLTSHYTRQLLQQKNTSLVSLDITPLSNLLKEHNHQNLLEEKARIGITMAEVGAGFYQAKQNPASAISWFYLALNHESESLSINDEEVLLEHLTELYQKYPAHDDNLLAYVKQRLDKHPLCVRSKALHAHLCLSKTSLSYSINQAIELFYEVAKAWHFGHPIEINLRKASDYYEIAGNLGHIPSKHELANLLFETDSPRAVALYEEVLAAGNKNVAYLLAMYYDDNNVSILEKARIPYLYETAINIGNVDAAYRLAHFYDISHDKEQAEQWYRFAIRAGHAVSIEALYAFQKKNYLYKFELAELIQQNDINPTPQIQHAIAYQYALTLMPTQSKTFTDSYYTMAFSDMSRLHKKADEGCPESDFVLGHAYLKGLNGITVNEKLAHEYLVSAADKEYQPAWNLLGMSYLEKEDWEQAISALEKGCEKGFNLPALSCLFYLYLLKEHYSQAFACLDRMKTKGADVRQRISAMSDLSHEKQTLMINGLCMIMNSDLLSENQKVEVLEYLTNLYACEDMPENWRVKILKSLFKNLNANPSFVSPLFKLCDDATLIPLISHYETLLKGNDHRAAYPLAIYYHDIKGDSEKILPLYEMAAFLDNADAAWRMAKIQDVPGNRAIAESWYRLTIALDPNHAPADLALSLLQKKHYLYYPAITMDVLNDKLQEAHLYPEIYHEIGRRYEFGLGVCVSQEQANSYYAIAFNGDNLIRLQQRAKEGDPESAFALGRAYLLSLSTCRLNYSLGKQLISFAFEKAHDQACYLMGEIALKENELRKAKKYFKQADKKGYCPESTIKLSYSYSMFKKFDKAIDACKRLEKNGYQASSRMEYIRDLKKLDQEIASLYANARKLYQKIPFSLPSLHANNFSSAVSRAISEYKDKTRELSHFCNEESRQLKSLSTSCNSEWKELNNDKKDYAKKLDTYNTGRKNYGYTVQSFYIQYTGCNSDGSFPRSSCPPPPIRTWHGIPPTTKPPSPPYDFDAYENQLRDLEQTIKTRSLDLKNQKQEFEKIKSILATLEALYSDVTNYSYYQSYNVNKLNHMPAISLEKPRPF